MDNFLRSSPSSRMSSTFARKLHRLALNRHCEGGTIEPPPPPPPSRPIHHGGNRRFYKESARLKTFARWPVTFLTPNQLAAAGFYYTSIEDVVRCPFCNIEVSRWERGDDPMVDHGRWSPNCRFVHGVETRNVPIGDGSSSDEDVTGHDVCGSGIIAPNSQLVPNPVELEQNYIPKRVILHPIFASYDARINSYAAWPKFMKMRPNQLSEAGFFYTGSGDQTICFHCGGGLRDWEETDDPWVEHAKNFPKCEYLLTAKGREFVEKARNPQNKPQSEEETGSKSEASGSSSHSTGIENLAQSSTSASQSEPSEPKEENRLCKICYTEEMGAAFYPCGHVVACTKCASSLTVCAVCRNPVKGTFRVFIS